MIRTFLALILLFSSLSASASVSIITTSLPNGTVGKSYNAAIYADTHGCKPYTWGISSGKLPAGLVLTVSTDTTSDLLHGTPTTAASYTFAVFVRGCGGHVSTRSYTVKIAAAATAHSVGLLCQPSSTPNVTYRMYRSTISGGYYGLIASPASCSYVDTAVSSGTTYYYVATAWDGARESARSNQATALIP